MRTRSQPLSPGGFIALDSEPRRTRSTRSTSRQPSAEPTTATRSTRSASIRQPSVEPTTQPATRTRRSASVRQSSAEPAIEPKTRATRSGSVRQSSAEPPTQTANRPRTQRVGNSKKSSSKATETQTRRRTASIRRSSGGPSQKASAEGVEQDRTSGASQITSITNGQDSQQEPEGHESVPSMFDTTLSEPKASDMNRKRPHDDEPQTPPANKRRNLGPPGTTPLARRMTSLSRQVTVPYSERKRRRTIESQGRIHKTVFRLPQLLAQNEADRRAAESTPLGPCPEPLQPAPETAEEHAQEDAESSAAEITNQAPSTPERSPSGWNIRGLINSVPRTFTRFLPGFGRSPRMTEPPATPQLISNGSAKLAVQPSSERTTRTQNADSEPRATETRDRSHRRLSEQPPSKRQRTLTYSLFPPPIDRALFLGDLSTTPKKVSQTVQSQPAQRLDEQAARPGKIPETDSQSTEVDEHRATPQSSEELAKKKRKRSSSPDVIPNPPGCSYGLDLDYFCYSSESEEEIDSQTQQTKPDPLVKSAVRTALRSERALSKKVRFDASPEDTPSKRRTRARATDPYEGKHFVGMGAAPGSPVPARGPSTPTPGSHIDLSSPQRVPGFTPNTQGTFQLDYDALSDDSDSNSGICPVTTPALEPASPEARISTALRTEAQESVQSPAPRQTPRPALAPATPAKVDKEALARVRSQAEKYKPKTPSGLRTASRYSSPLTLVPDFATPQLPAEQFGEDDQFARDAQWLYENCSSGDLKQLQWPAKHDLQQSCGVDNETIKIVDDLWDSVDLDSAQRVFQQTFEEFAQSLV